MSIYGTIFEIEDLRQTRASLEAHGIDFGIIDDAGLVEDYESLPPEQLDAPWVYQGSHVLPHPDDRRGGSVELATIPDHIERDDHPYGEDGTPAPFLRLSVAAEPSDTQYEGKPYVEGGYVTVVLSAPQITRLRDCLTSWLDAYGDPALVVPSSREDKP